MQASRVATSALRPRADALEPRVHLLERRPVASACR